MTIDVIETRPSEVRMPVSADNICDFSRLPVKRSLFGKVDRDESIRFLEEQMQEHQKEMSKKWNFDFANDRPLNEPGAYQWEKVQSPELVPRAYRLSWTDQLTKHIDSHIPEQMDSRRNDIESKSKLPKVTVSQPKLTQKCIDGYMKSAKRLPSGGDKKSAEPKKKLRLS